MNTYTDSSIARRLAAQEWEEVQKQRKVAEGIWFFSTARHGGYIVDINSHPDIASWKTEVSYKKFGLLHQNNILRPLKKIVTGQLWNGFIQIKFSQKNSEVFFATTQMKR